MKSLVYNSPHSLMVVEWMNSLMNSYLNRLPLYEVEGERGPPLLICFSMILKPAINAVDSKILYLILYDSMILTIPRKILGNSMQFL